MSTAVQKPRLCVTRNPRRSGRDLHWCPLRHRLALKHCKRRKFLLKPLLLKKSPLQYNQHGILKLFATR